MKIKYLISVFLSLFLFCLFFSNANAQFRDVRSNMNFTYKDFQVNTVYDTADMNTLVTIKRGDYILYNDNSDYMLDTVVFVDVDNTGSTNIFISQYSGGAHCCFQLIGGMVTDAAYTPTDTLFLGDVYFEFADLDNNNKYEIKSAFDGLAYAFTNFAETRFPTMVYRWENNKFVDVTKDYPALVNADIAEYTTQLKDFLMENKNFCPKTADEETFNTPAGSLKTILAAIAVSYSFIGQDAKGIEAVKTFYTCPDRAKFISTLEKDYKIK